MAWRDSFARFQKKCHLTKNVRQLKKYGSDLDQLVVVNLELRKVLFYTVWYKTFMENDYQWARKITLNENFGFPHAHVSPEEGDCII